MIDRIRNFAVTVYTAVYEFFIAVTVAVTVTVTLQTLHSGMKMLSIESLSRRFVFKTKDGDS